MNTVAAPAPLVRLPHVGRMTGTIAAIGMILTVGTTETVDTGILTSAGGMTAKGGHPLGTKPFHMHGIKISGWTRPLTSLSMIYSVCYHSDTPLGTGRNRWSPSP